MTSDNRKTVHEPLFHIAKRTSLTWWKAWIIRIASVLLALIACGIVTILLTHQNPIDVYVTMFNGAFGTPRLIWSLLQNIAMLLCVALAVTPAFKMRFWNLGAEGQVLVGGLATASCMIFLGNKLPTPLLIIVMVAASVLASCIWALLPALFKAKWNANETLFTLMMNYIAMQLVAYYTNEWAVPKGSGTLGIIKQGWLPTIGIYTYLLNIIIVALLTVFMFVYLKYSKHGYEIAVVGESENTAKYIGINVNHVVVRTMLLSGAICGIAGLLLVGGTDHTLSRDTVGGRGFTAVMVSWLAKFNPIFMIITSFLIVFLQKGAIRISETFNLNKSFSDMLTGIIIFFIIGSEFFINYQIKLTKSHKEASK